MLTRNLMHVAGLGRGGGGIRCFGHLAGAAAATMQHNPPLTRFRGPLASTSLQMPLLFADEGGGRAAEWGQKGEKKKRKKKRKKGVEASKERRQSRDLDQMFSRSTKTIAVPNNCKELLKEQSRKQILQASRLPNCELRPGFKRLGKDARRTPSRGQPLRL